MVLWLQKSAFEDFEPLQYSETSLYPAPDTPELEVDFILFVREISQVRLADGEGEVPAKTPVATIRDQPIASVVCRQWGREKVIVVSPTRLTH